MQRYLKRLERPSPGSGGQGITRLTAFIDKAEPDKSETLAVATYGDAGSTFVLMQESLLVMPESFDEALLVEVMPDLQNPE